HPGAGCMSVRLTCPQGHEWEASPDLPQSAPIPCPTCQSLVAVPGRRNLPLKPGYRPRDRHARAGFTSRGGARDARLDRARRDRAAHSIIRRANFPTPERMRPMKHAHGWALLLFLGGSAELRAQVPFFPPGPRYPVGGVGFSYQRRHLSVTGFWGNPWYGFGGVPVY